MSQKRNFGLDLLRSHGCILIVVLAHGAFLFYHLWSEYRMLWYVGNIGMDMFFALSGFLIGGILLDEIAAGRGWAKRFWMRRWIRTLPTYYLFLTINIALWLYSFGPVPEWPKFFVFMQNFAWRQSPFFSESWSLALEEVFYLLAPIVFLLFSLDPKRPKRTLIVWGTLIICGILFRWGWVLVNNPSWAEDAKKIVVVRSDAIAWGLLAVQWLRYAQPSHAIKQRMAISGLVLIAIATVIFAVSHEDTSVAARVLPFTLNGAAFALIMPWCATLDPDRVPRWYWLTTNRLAVWSYSWYLTHLVCIRLLDIFFPTRYGWGLTICKYLAYVSVSLFWARMNYVYFEKPILRWRDRIIGSSQFHILPVDTGSTVEPMSDLARQRT